MRTTAIAIALAITLATGATWADGTGLTPPPEAKVLSSIPVGAGVVPLPAAARAGAPAILMVELTGEPAIQTYLKAKASGTRASAVRASQTRIADILAAQDKVAQAIASKAPGTEVLYGVQRTFNGLVVRTSGKNFRALATVKGVKAVHVMRPKTVENSTSVPFIDTLAAWQYYGNYTGAGVKLGIVDTGIDYIHLCHGGTGIASHYTTNDTTTTGDISDFPNSKVVGGVDLVGDTYTGSSSDVAVPDDDPMDLAGHGTHVAGSAAGWGVKSDGTVYDGPWDASVPFSTLRIGPGVAPEAQVYAVKIFGPTGGTYYVVQGIEWCVDPDGNGDYSDMMDVVNMSVGSEYGGDFEADVVAMNNAVALGVFFACSAGNSGDTYYITGSPGMASRAISVANSLDMASVTALEITSPTSIAGNYACQPSIIGPSLDDTGFSGLVVMTDPADASTALTNAAEINGNIALIDRGNASFLTKVQNAQDAGATAVIVANNAGDDLTVMNATVDDSGITIPSVFIGQTDGNTLKGQLPGVVADCNILLEIRDTSYADTMASSSSRGPASTYSRQKPDISAPGASIMSAGMGTGNLPARMGGTSMASPHVAGAAALARQMHPDWTCEEIKALLINTAHSPIYTDANMTTPTYSPARQGVGRLNVEGVSTQGAIAYCSDGDPGAVSLSFGAPEIPVGASATSDHIVTITDKGYGGVTYNLTYEPTVDAPGVDISFPDGATVAVATSGTATFRVRISIDGSALRHGRDPALDAYQGSNARAWLAEESGLVRIKESDRGTRAIPSMMSLPLFTAPRPSADMATDISTLDLSGGTGTIDVILTGDDVQTGGSPPYDIVSLVHPFELTYQSPDDALSSGLLNFADIKHVGVLVADQPEPLDNRDIYFGVSHWGDIPSPNMCEVDILIDNDQNGSWDYVLFSGNSGTLSGESPTDAFWHGLYNFSSGQTTNAFVAAGGLAPNHFDMHTHNTNLRTFWLSDAMLMGITAGNPDFDYKVATYYQGVKIDETPTLTYDASAPGLQAATGIYPDYDATTISLAYNQTNFNANGSEGLLLQHRHNAQGYRSQIILPLGVGTPTPTPTPTVTPTATATPTSPPPDADIETNQAVSIESTGSFWAIAWNYNTAQAVGTLSTAGSGVLNYSIAVDAWVGIFLYDFTSAMYSEGFYIYNESM